MCNNALGGANASYGEKHIPFAKEVENQAGTLAHTLEPLAKTGANLRVLMGYRYPGNEKRAAIELYPVSGKKATLLAHSLSLHEHAPSQLRAASSHVGRQPTCEC